MKIAVVTDSTAYLSDEEVAANNIKVVPIPVIIDGKSYQEGIDITTSEFYDKLRTSKSFPSTSQPPLGEMISLYEELARQGYDAVISIHLSSTISGFVNSLSQVAAEINDIKVVPYDSQVTVKLMGYLVLEATKLARQGLDVPEIIQHLDNLRATIDNLFVVDDLQNLVRGGRLSNASAFLGSILKIKPLLTMNTPSHEIEAFEKVRSTKKALARVEELFDQSIHKVDYPIRAIVIHANNDSAALKWREKLAAKYPEIPFEISYFGPVIGTHLGEKALALAWLQDTSRS
ncbi:DegV family protein [Paucilactobacillus wasatchensis]|uniref:DegV family like protein n=1 Tax=Paucilactobacillus wasatchensis TaxID=1335616 RepID=A0A0D0YXU7_9LACO|nr:DegV family protein [Paucilactobacillus wasatchensis]KIS04029.1 DegV family like protein [Paucilactobacillus wasatchensis]